MVKRWVACALLALMLVPVPFGAAQADGAIELFSESGSDVAVAVGGQVVPNGGRFTQLDLALAAVAESPEGFAFTIGVADLSPDVDPILLEQGTLRLAFDVRDVRYAVLMSPSNGNGALQRYDPGLQRFASVRSVQVVTDVAASTLTAHVDRNDLLDGNGSAPFPGMEFHDFQAESFGFLNNAQLRFGDGVESDIVTVHDALPNGGPEGTYLPVYGIRQDGHLRLASDDPVRASNGEETTYVFEVGVQNLGTSTEDVALSTSGVPDTWEVTLPADRVRLEGNTTVHVPVLVHIPFAHRHGEFASFLVEARSASDAGSVGRIELGVRFTEVPQPAGHHNTLWFHSYASSSGNDAIDAFNGAFGSSASTYFNAVEDDDNDEGIDVPASQYGASQSVDPDRPFETRFRWRIHLDPTIQIGLDFDLERTGTLQFPVSSQLPMTDAVLAAELWYRSASAPSAGFNPDTREFTEDEAILLGSFAPSAPTTTGAGASTTFELEFTPTEASDFVLYDASGASVWLDVTLSVARPSTFIEPGTEPMLLPGALMELPLNEYQDPVDDLFHSLTAVHLMADVQQKLVNPGETVLFEFRIHNGGVVDDRFALGLEGPHEEWARILGDTIVSVGAGQDRLIVLAVQPPATAQQGDQVDLIVQASSLKDPDASALIRLLAEVDTLQDHPDQTSMIASTDDELSTAPTTVPVPLWPALVALLGAAFLSRRLLERP